jgi:hypothetical protein
MGPAALFFAMINQEDLAETFRPSHDLMVCSFPHNFYDAFPQPYELRHLSQQIAHLQSTGIRSILCPLYLLTTLRAWVHL